MRRDLRLGRRHWVIDADPGSGRDVVAEYVGRLPVLERVDIDRMARERVGEIIDQGGLGSSTACAMEYALRMMGVVPRWSDVEVERSMEFYAKARELMT